jgi:hypothetical protein
MIFGDISNFNKVSDYLPILNGALLSDLLIIFFAYHGIINSFYLRKWYKKYQLSAVVADVLILVIGIIIARFLYKYIFDTFSIVKFTGLAVVIQVIHDILFYLFFQSLPLGYNAMLDFFKDYAKEKGGMAIVGDSVMMILACISSSYFETVSLNSNIILLVIFSYFVPYMINYI